MRLISLALLLSFPVVVPTFALEVTPEWLNAFSGLPSESQRRLLSVEETDTAFARGITTEWLVQFAKIEPESQLDLLLLMQINVVFAMEVTPEWLGRFTALRSASQRKVIEGREIELGSDYQEFKAIMRHPLPAKHSFDPEKLAQAIARRPAEPAIAARRKGQCEDGHWIGEVSEGGNLVELEDGSLWRIDIADTTDTMLWLPTEDIVVCGDTLINADNKEKVSASRIR